MPRVGTSTGRDRPTAQAPTAVSRRDVVVAAALILVAILEGVLRPDLAWPVVTTAVAVVLLAALPWRRRHPLALVLALTGSTAVLDVAQFAAGVAGEGLVATFALLLAPYSLFRWAPVGSRTIGSVALAIGVLLSAALGPQPGGEAVIGAVVGLLLVGCACLLGALRRERVERRERELAMARANEREALARELHDTVGHHVSAIAIRAQAAAFAIDDPKAVATSLGVIETEARTVLDEMRSLVRALRTTADYTPTAGLADLARLASEGPPRVTVTIGETGDDTSDIVAATVYRVAQEAVTNARRHAVGVTDITIALHGEGGELHLLVRDDGRDSTSTASPGYGLVGMRERAALLGGTVEAGPQADGGWLLHARLPRSRP